MACRPHERLASGQAHDRKGWPLARTGVPADLALELDYARLLPGDVLLQVCSCGSRLLCAGICLLPLLPTLLHQHLVSDGPNPVPLFGCWPSAVLLPDQQLRALLPESAVQSALTARRQADLQRLGEASGLSLALLGSCPGLVGLQQAVRQQPCSLCGLLTQQAGLRAMLLRGRFQVSDLRDSRE